MHDESSVSALYSSTIIETTEKETTWRGRGKSLPYQIQAIEYTSLIVSNTDEDEREGRLGLRKETTWRGRGNLKSLPYQIQAIEYTSLIESNTDEDERRCQPLA
jgi:hypothetical protein